MLIALKEIDEFIIISYYGNVIFLCSFHEGQFKNVYVI